MTASSESKPARVLLRAAVVVFGVMVVGCSDSTPPPAPAPAATAPAPEATKGKGPQPGSPDYSGKGVSAPGGEGR